MPSVYTQAVILYFLQSISYTQIYTVFRPFRICIIFFLSSLLSFSFYSNFLFIVFFYFCFFFPLFRGLFLGAEFFFGLLTFSICDIRPLYTYDFHYKNRHCHYYTFVLRKKSKRSNTSAMFFFYFLFGRCLDKTIENEL